MKLSYSLRKGLVNVSPGRMLNKFKIKKRRSVLFFEEILANYIKGCETAGYSKELENSAYVWGTLGTQKLMPSIFKSLPLALCFNLLGKKVWTNVGLMDDICLTKEKNNIILETKNEFITRIIGPNNFLTGFYKGGLSALRKKEAVLIKAFQNTNSCGYVFRLTKEKPVIEGKEKAVYDTLNKTNLIKGFTLKDAIKKSIFQLSKDNKIYFRNRLLLIIENTIFHLLSNSKINIKSISEISYKYFLELIGNQATKEQKLNLLKILLQSMGWGIVKIITNEQKITIYIQNPPYGLQSESENWDFFIQTIFGYMKVINRNLILKNTSFNYNTLKIVFSED